MNQEQKIHLLCQELIVIMDELEPDTQHVIRDHINVCPECKDLYKKVMNSEINFPEPRPNKNDQKVEIKPLKRLTQFHFGLRLFIIAIRVLILAYIIYPAIKYHDQESYWITFDLVHSGILLFYKPAALFLLVFSFIFLNRRWFWTSFVVDLTVIFSLSSSLKLFL